MNNLDIDECKKKGIAVFYTPKANIIAVAEHIFTFILCFLNCLHIKYIRPLTAGPEKAISALCRVVAPAPIVTCLTSAKAP